MFRALVALRIVVLAYALLLNALRWGNFDREALGMAANVVMVLWTGFAIWAYAAAPRRRPPLLVADMVVAVGLLLSSGVIKGENMRATVTGFWVTGALMAWAIVWNWWGGLLGAVLISAADLSVRTRVETANLSNLFLLLIAGPIVGYLAMSIQRMAGERDVALRAAAIAEERTRLARAVHDGVLQVLSLTQRRGREPGGDAELGRLAGEQEAALRSLIREQDVTRDVGSSMDLTPALERAGAGRPLRLHVVTPGASVVVPEPVGTELLAVVGACLDNVAAHVGAEAEAWVLLEELPGEVAISVRDEGPGIPEGRLSAAEAEGRLGVASSIRGRMAGLGGSAQLTTGKGQGTEWELRVPTGREKGADGL